MNGLGFLIWKLSAMPAVEQVIALLKNVGARWVTIKVADNEWPYNQIGGNDKALKAFIESLQAAGIEVGGWHWVDPDRPGPAGDRAEERRQKLGLSHYLLDVEGNWNLPYGAGQKARTLCDKLHNGILEVALCAPRYPHYFPGIPFAQFMKHEKMDAATPMLYWEGLHNPVEQLQASLAEYTAFSQGKPFIPIGATYANKQADGSIWEPTPEDLTAFVDECKAQKFKAYGFYSLDWIVQHNRQDWLEAIAGEPINPPTPPPSSDILIISNCSWLNGRSAPDPTVDNRVIAVRAGQQVLDQHQDSGNWKFVSLGLIKCWMHGDYLEPA